MTDPLTDIVSFLQLSARFSKVVEGAGAWRVRRQGDGDPFYCAVLEGTCFLSVDGYAPVTLQAGDFVLVPAVHGLVNGSVGAPDDLLSQPVEIGKGRFRVGFQEGPTDQLICIGHCSFGSPDAALLVPLLPRVLLVRREPRLVALVEMLGEEARAQRPGRDVILERLLEVLLIEALRGAVDTVDAPGLMRGMMDERLSPALRVMHAQPENSWTIAELATKTALSRAAFFARFNRTVGMPPMEYLLIWRMALAKRLLRDQQLGLALIAERVGYSSASTFSVAFVRHVGMTPARFAHAMHA